MHLRVHGGSQRGSVRGAAGNVLRVAELTGHEKEAICEVSAAGSRALAAGMLLPLMQSPGLSVSVPVNGAKMKPKKPWALFAYSSTTWLAPGV